MSYSLEIEGLVSHKHKLEAEIKRLRAENRCLHETHRWNIMTDGADLLICACAHEKHEDCRFYRYRMVDEASSLSPAQGRGES
jgi:hypothetical protein